MEEDFIKHLLEYVKSKHEILSHNTTMFEIYEGDLLGYLVNELKRQMSGESSQLAALRASPINILNKTNQKLSKLYVNGVKRTSSSDVNNELIQYYSERANDAFHSANENYNLYKNTCIEIYEDMDEKEIGFRSIPSNLFLPYSDNDSDPTKPTGILKLMGKHGEKNKDKYWFYTADSFTPFYSDKKIVDEDLEGNEGENTFEILPFTYISKSKYLLIPKTDKDLLQMTLLIPVLLTDNNFSSMFLSMPILYGINIDAQNLKLSPNQFWNVKTDDADKTPTVGVLKAEPDLQSMMNNAISQLSMYFETRNIRPGTVGKITGDNFASGVSKLISEMDTIEDRKMQSNVFQKAETDFWRRVGIIHNKLARAGRLSNRMLFKDPEKMIVKVEYPEEKVIESRELKVDRLSKELNAGLTSRRSAIKSLNPKMTDDDIDKLIQEIKSEGFIDDNKALK